MNNFTPIRNGILDHIAAGRLCPFDLGIYVFLHLLANWATGIYLGCALTIAHQFNDPSLREHIQKSLRRLRDHHYINYPRGEGRRGSYPILIHKYEVTVGELSGHRLNAWKHGALSQPDYAPWNGHGTVVAQSRNSGGTVVAPIQDLLDIQDVPDVQDKTKRSGAEAPPLPDWIPADAWNGFVDMRNKKRAPLTRRAVILLLKDLEKLRNAGENVGAVLDQSTKESWKSVYPLKGNHSNGNRAQQRQNANLEARQQARAAIVGN